jgi:phage-related protein
LGSGVFEFKAESGKDTYRLVYLVKLRAGIFVLHAFMKKSKSGRAIPKEIKRTISARLKAVRELGELVP